MYEYKVVWKDKYLNDKEFKQEQFLNEMNDLNWQLVSVINANTFFVFYFKRLKGEKE